MTSASIVLFITFIVISGSTAAGVVSWLLGGMTAAVKYNKCVQEAWFAIDILCHYRYDLAVKLCNETRVIDNQETDKTRCLRELITEALAAGTDRDKRVPLEQKIGRAIWDAMEEIYDDRTPACGNAIVMDILQRLRSTNVELTRLYLTYNIGADRLSSALQSIPGKMMARRANYKDSETRFKPYQTER